MPYGQGNSRQQQLGVDIVAEPTGPGGLGSLLAAARDGASKQRGSRFEMQADRHVRVM